MDRKQAISETPNKKVGFRQYLFNLEIKFPETEDHWFDFLLQMINLPGRRFPILPKHLYTKEITECGKMANPKLGDFYNSVVSVLPDKCFGVYFGLKTTKDKGLVFCWFNLVEVNKKFYAVDFSDPGSGAVYFGHSVSKDFLADKFFEHSDYWSLLEEFAMTKPYNFVVITAAMRQEEKRKIAEGNHEWNTEILLGEHAMLDNTPDDSKKTVIQWLCSNQ